MGSTVSRTDPDSRATRNGTQSNGAQSYADVVERLFGEFENRYPLSVIVDTVHECRAQLSCSPETAMPELLERRARQRLGAGQPVRVT